MLARGQGRRAARAARSSSAAVGLSQHLERLPESSARGRSIDAVARLDAAARWSLRIRAAQHLRAAGPDEPRRSSSCPATGSAPRSSPRRARVLDAVGDFEYEEHLVGGASIDAHGTALTDEVLDACRGADAVLLGAVGGPKWDTTDPGRAAARAGAARPAQGPRPVREPAPGAAERRRCSRASPLREERIARHRPARRPRADRRHLLRRLGPRRRSRPRHLRVLGRRDRADRAGRRSRPPRRAAAAR